MSIHFSVEQFCFFCTSFATFSKFAYTIVLDYFNYCKGSKRELDAVDFVQCWKKPALMSLCLTFSCNDFDVRILLETEEDIIKTVMKGKLKMEDAPWPSISASAKDLVSKMLTRDPKKRISAAEALGKYLECSLENLRFDLSVKALYT